jgi:DNA-directed RNA polymerase subunit RPC12/RpoP
MEPLDGNAIAGPLAELYGAEMTTASGICRNCGAEAQIAELQVYLSGPGAVARCPSCGSVVFVLAEIRGSTLMRADQFELRS